MIDKKYYRHIVGSLCLALAFGTALHHRFVKHKSIEASQLPPPPPSIEDVVEEEPLEKVSEKVIRLKKGETLVTALAHQGIDRLKAQEVAEAMKKVFNPKDLRSGLDIYLSLREHRDFPGVKTLEELSFETGIDTDVTVKLEEGVYKAQKDVINLVKSVRKVTGTIKTGLYADASKKKVPARIVHEMSQNLAYEVDFQRAFHPGDQFSLMYETKVNPETLKEQPGILLFGQVELQDKTVSFYYFKPDKGVGGYYNAKGESIKKGLLRTPIDGARISSRFGNRRHPILGYSKAHKGVDFSAPSGTPIMASGEGVVEKAGRSGGYGNVVKIRHNKEYSTVYGHMSRFAKGMKSGKRVKQGEIIGYVGATGLATGPHLHYELLRFNNQINPDKVKMMPAIRLSGKDLARFKAFKVKVDKQTEGFKQTPNQPAIIKKK